MIYFFNQLLWSQYVAGARIGVLICIAFRLSNRPIGGSTAFVKVRGLIGRNINRDRTEKKKYYWENIPQGDWAFMIIPGIVIGAFISSPVISISSGCLHCGARHSVTIPYPG